MKQPRDKQKPQPRREAYRPARPVEFVKKFENEWTDWDRYNGFSIADAAAIQACMNGVADSRQQKRSMDWIIRVCAKTYDLQYFDSPRDTDFALGKKFVGDQIVLLSKLDTGELEKIVKLNNSEDNS